MTPIRTAILGYGRSGGSMHAGAIEKNPNFELVAACDIDPARRRQAGERFGCAVYEDYHAMLAEERLDLVCVITRSDQHCAMACDCLESGVNVLVTKPWATNAAEAERMVATAKGARGVLMPWLPARWGSDLQRLRELVAGGAIGRVFLVRRAVSSFGTRCDWQTERRFGGGYLLNWGPHIIDPPLLLAGSPVHSVYGRMKQTINPGDVEDLFLAVMTLCDGTIVQAEYTISVATTPSWILQGDRGTIVVRGREVTVHRQTPSRPDDPTKFATMQADSQQISTEELPPAVYGDEHEVYAEIADAVSGVRPFPVMPADALELSRVLDAIRTSADEDRVVSM